MGLRLASKLDGDLAVEDGLAIELSNGALGLRRSGEVDEGVADGAGGAGVGRNGGGLAGRGVSSCGSRVEEATYTK